MKASLRFRTLPWRPQLQSLTLWIFLASLVFNSLGDDESKKNIDLQLEAIKQEEHRLSHEMLRQHPPPAKAIQYRDKKLCLIIETRAHPQLISHITYMARYLPSDWPITVMHGTANLKHLQDNPTIKELVIKGTVKLHNLGLASINLSHYNLKMLINPDWWETIEAEHVLISEIDSVYCPNSTNQLDDFLHWGFVGAQCKNSGISLWRRSVAMCVCSRWNYSTEWGAWPDVYINQQIELHNCGKAVTPDVCNKFSVELNYHPNSLAMHVPIYPCTELTKILDYCPEMITKKHRTSCPKAYW